MKMNRVFLAVLLVAGFSLLLACGDYEYTPSNSKFTHYTMQGTWVSQDPSVYSGTLVITYNTITITGYSEAQTLSLPGGDDSKRPFKRYMKNVLLKCYVEDDLLFIIDPNSDPEEETKGLPYVVKDFTMPDYSKIKVLIFNFGGREEVLQKVEEKEEDDVEDEDDESD